MTDHVLTPPSHSVQAEQAVLGGLLINPKSLPFVQDIVASDDFYRHEHRLIFRAIESLANDGDEIDVVTVAEELESQDVIDETGGLPYLGELHQNTPAAKNVGSYARLVANHAKARKIATLSRDMLCATGDDWQNIADNVMRELLAIAGVQRKWECGLADALNGAIDIVEAAYQRKGLVGVPTGLTKLDSLMGGLHETDLIVVGGRPSMGKTAFMLRCVLAADCPVGIISGEQPRDQVALRMAGMEGRLNASRLRNGQLKDDEWPVLTSSVSKLNKRLVQINDQPGITIAQIVRQARTWKQQHDIGVLFVDYLQKIKTTSKTDKRHEQVGEVAQELKNLAKELRIPVVALAQVNRSVESRTDKRPRMGDLKDSGEIEQEADTAILLYRDEVYDDESKDKGTAELIVDKNRHGPTGFIRVAWVGECMRFDDLVQQWTTGLPDHAQSA